MTKSSTTKAPKNARKAKNAVVRDVPLKAVLNDIIKADKSRTLTTKQMRVVLRREFAVELEHARNALWTFTAAEAQVVRARFDPKFRASLDKSAKRAARKPKAPVAETPATADA